MHTNSTLLLYEPIQISLTIELILKVCLSLIIFCVFLTFYIWVDYYVGKKMYLPLKERGNSTKQFIYAIRLIKNLSMMYKYGELDFILYNLKRSFNFNIVLDNDIVDVVNNILSSFTPNAKTLKTELKKIEHLL